MLNSASQLFGLQFQLMQSKEEKPQAQKSTQIPIDVKKQEGNKQIQKAQDKQETERLQEVKRMVQQRSQGHSIVAKKVSRSQSVRMNNFQKIIQNNKIWAKTMLEQDSFFFKDLAQTQTPQYLWIGCSDSRVPANQIVGLRPGQLFVHRNIANQVPLSDINCLSVIQFAVEVLKVQDIIVAGHFNCGGIKAAFRKHDHGPLEAWLSHIRDLRARYRQDLKGTEHENEEKLVKLNVRHQVYNVAKVPTVQKAWKRKQVLRIHGLVYRLEDGILMDEGITLYKISQLPEEFKIIQ